MNNNELARLTEDAKAVAPCHVDILPASPMPTAPPRYRKGQHVYCVTSGGFPAISVITSVFWARGYWWYTLEMLPGGHQCEFITEQREFQLRDYDGQLKHLTVLEDNNTR